MFVIVPSSKNYLVDVLARLTSSANTVETEGKGADPTKDHCNEGQPRCRTVCDVEVTRRLFYIVFDDLHGDNVDDKRNSGQQRGEHRKSHSDKSGESSLSKGEPERDEESNEDEAAGEWIQYECRCQPCVDRVFEVLEV